MMIVQKNSKAVESASDGFVLVAVLWLLAALATFASVYAVYVINTASAFRGYDDRLRAEALVSAGTELVAYQLSSKVLHHPTEGRFSFRMGQADIAVDYRSEAARIDLNAAPKELLIGLFAALGAQRDDADEYADRVIAWRTAPTIGQDREAAAYKAAGLKYVPRGAAFPNADELSLVLDLPAELVRRALPLVTVYSGLGKVNVLEALPEVIAALPAMTPERLNTVLAERQVKPDDGQALLPLLGPSQAYAGAEASKVSRVTVHVALDDGFHTASEVIVLTFETGNEPYSVLSWRDQLDDSPTDGLGRPSR